jgi:hypothetical protein
MNLSKTSFIINTAAFLEINDYFLLPFVLLNWTLTHVIFGKPVRIWVIIGPPHPLVCRKTRLNGEVLQMRPENRGPVSQHV